MTLVARPEVEALRNEGRERNISFVADCFERTVQWVRWCETEGRFRREDGSYIVPRRTQPARAAAGFRKYTLWDIKEMADSALREDLISVEKHQRVMDKIVAFGRLG